MLRINLNSNKNCPIYNVGSDKKIEIKDKNNANDILIKDANINFENAKLKIAKQLTNESLLNNSILEDREFQLYEKLYSRPENIDFVKDAMFGSTNEQYGTSFKSRFEDLKYQFAGKTGTSPVSYTHLTLPTKA